MTVPVGGQSVFSRHMVDQNASISKAGGLHGSKITSIEEVDDKVEALSVTSDEQWVKDYLAMKRRRRGPE